MSSSKDGHKSKAAQEQLNAARRRFRSKHAHFLCTLPLRNRLPEPVPGPKLVQLPFDLQSFVEFKPTTLDTEYKWKHHSERSLGVHVDLVDLEAHTPAPPDQRPALHPDDERLLNWDAHHKTANGVQGLPIGSRSGQYTWLKKTQFTSNDLTTSVHMFKSGAQIKAEEHERIVEESKALGNDAHSLLDAAERSFHAHNDDASALRHPSKPGVTAQWSIPLLPDQRLWANDFVHVGFEDDPAPSNPRKRARVQQGLVVNARPVRNEKQQRTVVKGVFVLPADDEAEAEGQDRAFEWERQYQVETKDAENSYVLFIDEANHAATYVEHSASKVELRSGLSTKVARKESDGIFSLRRCEMPPELIQHRHDALSMLTGDAEADHESAGTSDSEEGMSSSADEMQDVAGASDEEGEEEEDEAEEEGEQRDEAKSE